MKRLLIKIILFLPLFLAPAALKAPADSKIFILRHEGYKPLETLYNEIWQAVCFIESTNNPNAFNEKELARGIAQIRPCKIEDYNRLTGNNIGYEDVFCPELSKQIFMWHLSTYGTDWQTGIRRWNGDFAASYIYLEKVLKVMNYKNN